MALQLCVRLMLLWLLALGRDSQGLTYRSGGSRDVQPYFNPVVKVLPRYSTPSGGLSADQGSSPTDSILTGNGSPVHSNPARSGSPAGYKISHVGPDGGSRLPGYVSTYRPGALISSKHIQLPLLFHYQTSTDVSQQPAVLQTKAGMWDITLGSSMQPPSTRLSPGQTPNWSPQYPAQTSHQQWNPHQPPKYPGQTTHQAPQYPGQTPYQQQAPQYLDQTSHQPNPPQCLVQTRKYPNQTPRKQQTPQYLDQTSHMPKPLQYLVQTPLQHQQPSKYLVQKPHQSPKYPDQTPHQPKPLQYLVQTPIQHQQPRKYLVQNPLWPPKYLGQTPHQQQFPLTPHHPPQYLVQTPNQHQQPSKYLVQTPHKHQQPPWYRVQQPQPQYQARDLQASSEPEVNHMKTSLNSEDQYADLLWQPDQDHQFFNFY